MRTIHSTRHAPTITWTPRRRSQSTARRMHCCVAASRSGIREGRGTLRVSWLHEDTESDQVLATASSSCCQASCVILTPWPSPIFLFNRSYIPYSPYSMTAAIFILVITIGTFPCACDALLYRAHDSTASMQSDARRNEKGSMRPVVRAHQDADSLPMPTSASMTAHDGMASLAVMLARVAHPPSRHTAHAPHLPSACSRACASAPHTRRSLHVAALHIDRRRRLAHQAIPRRIRAGQTSGPAPVPTRHGALTTPPTSLPDGLL